MDAVVLTFPGHTLHTALCLRSLHSLLTPSCIHLIIDDVASETWSTYYQDFCEWAVRSMPYTQLKFYRYSELGFQDCPSGWWRAQLVKLHVDYFLESDCWFVVDGDIIFDRISTDLIDITPYTRWHDGSTSVVATLHSNYVRRLLGTEQGHLTVGEKYVATSPVPFRVLDRSLLQGLRSHVENRYQKTFMNLHLDWFRDQTIIAYEDPPTKMIMSEWELIECYRHYVVGSNFPLVDVGSGYGIYKHTSLLNDSILYRHSYMRDANVSLDWFRAQGLTIPQSLWDKIINWTQQYERDRL